MLFSRQRCAYKLYNTTTHTISRHVTATHTYARTHAHAITSLRHTRTHARTRHYREGVRDGARVNLRSPFTCARTDRPRSGGGAHTQYGRGREPGIGPRRGGVLTRLLSSHTRKSPSVCVCVCVCVFVCVCVHVCVYPIHTHMYEVRFSRSLTACRLDARTEVTVGVAVASALREVGKGGGKEGRLGKLYAQCSAPAYLHRGSSYIISFLHPYLYVFPHARARPPPAQSSIPASRCRPCGRDRRRTSPSRRRR